MVLSAMGRRSLEPARSFPRENRPSTRRSTARAGLCPRRRELQDARGAWSARATPSLPPHETGAPPRRELTRPCTSRCRRGRHPAPRLAAASIPGAKRRCPSPPPAAPDSSAKTAEIRAARERPNPPPPPPPPPLLTSACPLSTVGRQRHHSHTTCARSLASSLGGFIGGSRARNSLTRARAKLTPHAVSTRMPRASRCHRGAPRAAARPRAHLRSRAAASRAVRRRAVRPRAPRAA